MVNLIWKQYRGVVALINKVFEPCQLLIVDIYRIMQINWTDS